MKVILNSDIEKRGKLGDIVDVKPGYARNFLLPKGLALELNKHNLEVMKYKMIKVEKQLELEKLSAEEQKQKLDQIVLRFEKKSGEKDVLFGSVTVTEIEHKLEQEYGAKIDRKKFHLDEPIKKLGDYNCRIKLFDGVEADIKIEVVKEGGDNEPEAETPKTETKAVETEVTTDVKEAQVEVKEDPGQETEEKLPAEVEAEEDKKEETPAKQNETKTKEEVKEEEKEQPGEQEQEETEESDKK